MKAILQYNKTFCDKSHMRKCFQAHDVEVINVSDNRTNATVTIRLSDYGKLLPLLYDLNQVHHYGVRLIKTKSDKTIFEHIKNFFI